MSSFKKKYAIFCVIFTVVAVHVVYAKLTREEYRSLLSQAQIRSQVAKRPTSSLVAKNPQQQLPPARTRRGAKSLQEPRVSRSKQQQQPRQARISASQAEVLKKRAQYISNPEEKKRLLQEVEKFGYEPEEKVLAERAHKIELEQQQRAEEKEQESKQREQTLEKQKSAQEEFAGHIALLSDTKNFWKNGMPTQAWVQTALQLLQNQQLIGNAPIFLLDAIIKKYNYFVWESNRREKQEDAQRLEKIKDQFVWRMVGKIFENYAIMLNKEKAFWNTQEEVIDQALLNDMKDFCCYLFTIYRSNEGIGAVKTWLYGIIDNKYALEKVQEDKLRADKEEVTKSLAQCSQALQRETAEKQTTKVAMETGFEALMEFMKNNKPKNKEEEQKNENDAISAAQVWLDNVPEDQRNAVIDQIKKEYREALSEQKWGHVLLGRPNVSKEFASFTMRLDALESARFVKLGQKTQQEQPSLSPDQQILITGMINALTKNNFAGYLGTQLRINDTWLKKFITLCVDNKIDIDIDMTYDFVSKNLSNKITDIMQQPNWTSSEKADEIIQRTLDRLQEFWKEKKRTVEAIEEEIPVVSKVPVPVAPEGQQKPEGEKPVDTIPVETVNVPEVPVVAPKNFEQLMERIGAGISYHTEIDKNEATALKGAQEWLENTPIEQRDIVIQQIKNSYKKALEQQKKPGSFKKLAWGQANIPESVESFNSRLDKLKNIPVHITSEKKQEIEKPAETVVQKPAIAPQQPIVGLQAVQEYISQLKEAAFENGPDGREITEAWLLNLIDIGNKNNVDVQGADVKNALQGRISSLAKENHWTRAEKIANNTQEQLLALQLKQQTQMQKETKLAEEKAQVALTAAEAKKKQIQEFVNTLTKAQFVDSDDGMVIDENWLRDFIKTYKAVGLDIGDSEVVGPLDTKIRALAQENGLTGIDEFIGRVLGRIAAMQSKV